MCKVLHTHASGYEKQEAVTYADHQMYRNVGKLETCFYTVMNKVFLVRYGKLLSTNVRSSFRPVTYAELQDYLIYIKVFRSGFTEVRKLKSTPNEKVGHSLSILLTV
jgi:hypothetical protein